MVKLVIFDLDGVIVSTDQLHYQAWKKIADQENIPFDKMINNRLRGVSRMDSLNIILEKASSEYSMEEKEVLAKKKNDYYLESLSCLNNNSLLPKVQETIEELKKVGIKVAIGSSSKNTKTILKYIGLIDCFDFISDGNNISRSKPYPDVFLYVTDKLHISPKDTIVVEDAKAGIDAANSGGMISVAIHDAKNYELANFGIDCLSELNNIIEKINEGGKNE